MTEKTIQTSFLKENESAPHNRTQTSIEAAVEIQPHLNRLEQIVLDSIKESIDGLTRDEIAKITDLRTATVCARCNALLKKSKIKPRFEETGKKITRPTDSGRKAEVLYFAA